MVLDHVVELSLEIGEGHVGQSNDICEVGGDEHYGSIDTLMSLVVIVLGS